MKALKDHFNGKVYRVVWTGVRIARLQDQGGNNRLMKLFDLEKLILENSEPVKDSWAIVERLPLTAIHN